MTAFESLYNKLSALGIYDLQEGTKKYAELMAYAEGLELIYEELDTLLKECFVSTAEDFGLNNYEDMMAVCNMDQSLSGRRNSIMSTLQITNSDSRMKDFDKICGIFNIHGTFSDEPGKLIFNCTDSLTADQKEIITEQMKKFCPVSTTLQFNTV